MASQLSTLELEVKQTQAVLRGRFGVIKEYIDKTAQELSCSIARQGRAISGKLNDSSRSYFRFGDVSPNHQETFWQQFLDSLDMQGLVDQLPSVSSTSGLSSASQTLGLELQLTEVEREFSSPEIVIGQLTNQKIQQLEKRRDINPIERGGVVFKDQRDIEALLCIMKDPEFY